MVGDDVCLDVCHATFGQNTISITHHVEEEENALLLLLLLLHMCSSECCHLDVWQFIIWNKAQWSQLLTSLQVYVEVTFAGGIHCKIALLSTSLIQLEIVRVESRRIPDTQTACLEFNANAWKFC
jgi:hypothetical protein